MSTYSHVSVTKTIPVKSSKAPAKRKNRNQWYFVTGNYVTGSNNPAHTWYADKAYPVLEN